jgi:hypothetical protein
MGEKEARKQVKTIAMSIWMNEKEYSYNDFMRALRRYEQLTRMRDRENVMGKFVRDFKILTERSGVINYGMLRDGLRKLLEQEIERAREEGYQKGLEDMGDWIKGEDSVPWEEDVDEMIKDLLSKLKQ